MTIEIYNRGRSIYRGLNSSLVKWSVGITLYNFSWIAFFKSHFDKVDKNAADRKISTRCLSMAYTRNNNSGVVLGEEIANHGEISPP